MFSLLRRFVEFVRQLQEEPKNDIMSSVFFSITWAVGTKINAVTDILGWINNNIDEFIGGGANEIYVIRGDSLADFIISNQRKYKYLVTNSDLKTLRNGVALVAVDGQKCIVKDQLILSKGGLSTETKEIFHGEAMLKVKLTN